MFLTECKKMLNVELASLKTCMYQVPSTTKNFDVPKPNPPQKGNSGKNLRRQLSNSELALLNTFLNQVLFKMKYLDVSQNKKKIDRYPTPFWGNIKCIKCWTILAHRGS